MFETLMRLYATGKLTGAGLANAVKKGWITETQQKDIMEVH